MPFKDVVTLSIKRETKERFDTLIKEYDFKQPKTYNNVLLQIIELYERVIERKSIKERGIISKEVLDLLDEPL